MASTALLPALPPPTPPTPLTPPPPLHVAEPADSIVAADDVAELVRLFDEDINAVLLARSLPEAVAADAERLLAELAAPVKVVVDAGPQLESAVLAALAGAPALAADVARWARVVADLAEAPLIGVRLARLEDAMCPRFHIDRVFVRLVTTYVGRGTELLAAADVDRGRLAPHHGGAPDEESGLLRDPRRIRRARAGEVVAMKGELWPSRVGAVVHRSPAITAPRLVLTLDPLE